MKSYNYKKEIPVIEQTDILVVGGGPAGIAAAVAAGRKGVKTVLVEKEGILGGMATSGLVGPFMTSYDKDGEQQIIKGIFDEFVVRREEKGGAIHPSKVPAGDSRAGFVIPDHDHCCPFDSETFIMTASEMVLEAGVKLILHSQFLDVIMNDDEISAVLISNKSGIQAIEAKLVIDCTGDADVAYRSGVPAILGDGNNFMQPATLFFRVGNVDSEKVKREIEANRYRIGFIGDDYKGNFHWLIEEARKNGDWDLPRLSLGMYENPRDGEWRINTSRILDVDGTDVFDLTRAEIEGRKQVETILNFMRKYVPGCENAILINTASVVGIRETRHIVGEYIMTKDDVIDGRVFEDSILLAAYGVDIHGKGKSTSHIEYASIEKGLWYGIPYRSLVPLKVNNLLVAGRSVSATSEAASAIRVMPQCMGMGEAAGTAAAIAVKDGVIPRNVDIKKLISTLKEQGVFLQ